MVMTPNPCKTLKQHHPFVSSLSNSLYLFILAGGRRGGGAGVPSHNISGRYKAVTPNFVLLSVTSHSSEWKFRALFLHWEIPTYNMLKHPTGLFSLPSLRGPSLQLSVLCACKNKLRHSWLRLLLPLKDLDVGSFPRPIVFAVSQVKPKMSTLECKPFM